jgi:hypothetical protein
MDTNSTEVDKKAEPSINSMPCGITIDLSALHAKADRSILCKPDAFSKTTDFKEEQRPKLDSPNIETDAGMMTSFTPAPMNTDASILSSFDPPSNTTVPSREQSMKLDLDNTRTLEGTTTDSKALEKNANSPMFSNLDSFANWIETNLQPEKHDFSRIETEAGR